MNKIQNQKDNELLTNFSLIVQKEREIICEVISYLSHIWDRKLYAEEGYSSLFSFLTEKYHYSKGAAYRRVQAAKLVQREPKVLNYFKEAKLNLTTIGLIEPYAKGRKQQELIEASLGKTKEEVEELLAQYSQKIEINRDKIRRLPVINLRPAVELKCINDEQVGSPETPEVSQKDLEIGDGDVSQKERKTSSQKELETFLPMSLILSDSVNKTKVEEIRRVKIEFVAKEALAKKIERAKQILRHKYPQGKLEDIFNEALELLLEKKDPERKMTKSDRSAVILSPKDEGSSPNKKRSFGRKRPQDDIGINRPKSTSHPATRYIPEKLRLEVYKRDKGQCSYIGKEGKPCQEKNFLEIDHVQPYALGGKNDIENLRIICAGHNKYRAEKTFGFQWTGK